MDNGRELDHSKSVRSVTSVQDRMRKFDIYSFWFRLCKRPWQCHKYPLYSYFISLRTGLELDVLDYFLNSVILLKYSYINIKMGTGMTGNNKNSLAFQRGIVSQSSLTVNKWTKCKVMLWWHFCKQRNPLEIFDQLEFVFVMLPIFFSMASLPVNLCFCFILKALHSVNSHSHVVARNWLLWITYMYVACNY